jgi:hypothetical protein
LGASASEENGTVARNSRRRPRLLEWWGRRSRKGLGGGGSDAHGDSGPEPVGASSAAAQAGYGKGKGGGSGEEDCHVGRSEK